MRRTLWAALLASVVAAAPAFAQLGQGRLTGIVTDQQGAVLPGVTVTVTSPALIGVQTFVTEADGRYRFPALPPGLYTVTVQLQGFKTIKRENISVVLGQTISVDAQLQVATLEETVTVTAESPVVDVTTTKVGANLTGEELIGVPTSTDVWGSLAQAPGIRMQGFDVGGSHKSQQSGYEVFGVQMQNRVVTEGIDHTEGVGWTGFYEDYYATEEVSVSALGSDVEMSSGGAALSSVTKSGGNIFKGLYHISYEPESWVGDNKDAELERRGFTGNPNLVFWEGHADLGGPIMRDKAWFFYAFNHFKIDKAVSGVSRDIATDLGIFDNHTIKGTWKPAEKDTFVGYFQQGRKQKPRRGLSALLPPESVRAQDSYSKMYKGEWQRVWSNRLFMTVLVGNFSLDWPMAVQVDPANRPPRLDLATGRVSGAGWNAFTTGRKKPQVKTQATYYLPDKGGSHDFKFGFEYVYDWYRFGINGTSGPVQYRDFQGVPIRVRFADVGTAGDFDKGWKASPNVDTHHSFYFQDRWAPNNRLSITAGVRVDRQRAYYNESVRKPIRTEIFGGESRVPGAMLVTSTDAAPRLGFTYDLTGKGRSVLKVFYGRYYNNFADGFSSANPGGTNFAEYNFNDLNRNRLYDGPQELGSLRFRLGGAGSTVNPALKTPHIDEVSATVEHQFWGESSIRGTYVRKMVRDWIPIYYTPLVPAWLGQLTVPRTVTVTSPQFGRETFRVVDIPDRLASLSDSVFDNAPDGKFDYDTIEVAFTKRFAQKFFFSASYDYQWRDELRSADLDNWGDQSPLGTDPIGVYFFINPNPAVPNRQDSTMWHGTLVGRYTFPYDFAVAANLRYQSGFPYARIIPDGATEPTLNLSPAPFFVENLKNNRSDNVALLNLRFDKAFRIGRTKLTALLDVYNVLNANPVTNFNPRTDGFGDIIAVLDPVVAQFGFRFEF